MLYLIAMLAAASVALVVYLVSETVVIRPPALLRRLSELEKEPLGEAAAARTRRRPRRKEFETLVRELGEKVEQRTGDRGTLRLMLIQAGYRSAAAPAYYWGGRVVLTAALGGGALLLAGALSAEPMVGLMAALWFAALGWVVPPFYVGRKRTLRQKEIQLALPDTLDLMVTCVEAGLGLNQALVRVAQEMYRLSPAMSEELALVNLEIRTGASREEALRNFGERTGVIDVRSLVAMLIQTDRFGTSIAEGLRIHSETLREKRRQRAEEAAAKTTIKMVFPLVLFIFPAMFVVILGSAMIQIFRALAGV